MFAARAALRSPTLRRGIYTGRTSTYTRSSWAQSGAVLVAGGITYAAYHYWNPDLKMQRIALDGAEPKPRQTRPARTASKETKKASENASVDDPAPVKPAHTEPGVLKPSGEAPTPTPDVGSNPPSEGEEQSEEDKDRAANEGAYNPETGEINWDCPCLGGMAHGPCGPQFREAFSCFVHSNEDPKGVDCVERFKAMQDCFREHPDVYGEEIDDDDEEETTETPEKPETSEGHKSLATSGSNAPSSPKAKPTEKGKPDTPSDVPSPPSSAPPSRASAPTANVSPGTTPTKSAKNH